MSHLVQKWFLRLPLGLPKVAPRLPQGPPRATPSSPRTPPGAFVGALPSPEGPPRPPQEHLRADEGGKRNQWFYYNKTYISAQGGAGSMPVKAFGRYWGLFFSSTAPFRLVFGSLGAPRFLFTCSAPLLAANLPLPGFPETPPGKQHVPFYVIKPMILQSRRFAKSAL